MCCAFQFKPQNSRPTPRLPKKSKYLGLASLERCQGSRFFVLHGRSYGRQACMEKGCLVHCGKLALKLDLKWIRTGFNCLCFPPYTLSTIHGHGAITSSPKSVEKVYPPGTGKKFKGGGHFPNVFKRAWGHKCSLKTYQLNQLGMKKEVFPLRYSW